MIKEILESYSQYLLASNFSEMTRIAYLGDLEQFFTFAASRRGRKPEEFQLADIDTMAVRSFIHDLVAGGVSKRSAARKLSSIRSFYKYAVREALVAESPVQLVKTPKNTPSLPRFLYREHVDKLFQLDWLRPPGAADEASGYRESLRGESLQGGSAPGPSGQGPSGQGTGRVPTERGPTGQGNSRREQTERRPIGRDNSVQTQAEGRRTARGEAKTAHKVDSKDSAGAAVSELTLKEEFVLWREQVILELLYGSGLRVSELVSLDMGHIDLTNKLLRVFGKGRKERIIPMTDFAVQAIRNYQGKREQMKMPLETASSPLLLNLRGGRLTTQSVRRILNSCEQRAQLNQHIYPHMLRHTYATHLLDGGADLRSVQELLGHKNLSSTQIYTHLTKERLRQTFLNAHPRAKLDNHD